MAKNACIGMWHQMHFLDLQRLYMFRTAGLVRVLEGTLGHILLTMVQ